MRTTSWFRLVWKAKKRSACNLPVRAETKRNATEGVPYRLKTERHEFLEYAGVPCR
jgi:hypothetical protein